MSLAGECYLFEDVGGRHLHIILTNPAGSHSQVIMVNITSWRTGSDETCIIWPEEHPFIKGQSVVFYQKASMVKESNIALIKRNGRALEPLSDRLLTKICEGICKSDQTPTQVKEFYRKYHT